MKIKKKAYKDKEYVKSLYATTNSKFHYNVILRYDSLNFDDSFFDDFIYNAPIVGIDEYLEEIKY